MPAILEEFLRGILLYLLAEVSYKTQNCMHVYCQYLMGVWNRVDIKSRMFLRNQSVFGSYETVSVRVCLYGHKRTLWTPCGASEKTAKQIWNLHVSRSWPVIIDGETTYITTLFKIGNCERYSLKRINYTFSKLQFLVIPFPTKPHWAHLYCQTFMNIDLCHP